MKYLPTLFLLLICQVALAQIPQTINFQGYLTNSTGEPEDGTESISFTIYRVADNTQVWTENHPTVEVTNGLYSVQLGSITPFSFAFDQAYDLEITVDAEILSPRISLNSSAFSLGAYGVFGDSNVFPADGNVGIGTLNPVANLHINATTNAILRLQDASGSWDFNAGSDFFITNSSGEEVLTLFNTDNVTIGNTTASGSDLLVKGAVTANSFIGDGSGLTNLPGTSSLWDNSNSPNIFYNGGNVGIGIANPFRLLHISSETGGADIFVDEYSDTQRAALVLRRANGSSSAPEPVVTDDGLGLLLFSGYNGTNLNGAGAAIEVIAEENFDTGSAGSKMNFYTDLAGDATVDLNTAQMTISNTGFVGIGTETPSSELEVAGDDAGGLGVRVTNSNSGGWSNYNLRNDASVSFALSVGGSTATIGANDFYIFNATTSNPALVIDHATDNVGIGKADPLWRVDIQDELASNINPVVRIMRNTASSAAPLRFENAASSFNIGITSNNEFAISGPGSNIGLSSDFIRIQNGGNVGIGTTNPASELDVDGTVTAADLSVAAGEVSVTSTGYTQLGSSGVSVSAGSSVSHPAFKVLMIEGTTGAPNGTATVTINGISTSQIISAEVLVNDGSGSLIPAGFTTVPNFEFQFNFAPNGANSNLFVRNVSGNSGSIGAKSFRAIIRYIE